MRIIVRRFTRFNLKKHTRTKALSLLISLILHGGLVLGRTMFRENFSKKINYYWKIFRLTMAQPSRMVESLTVASKLVPPG